MDGNQQYDWWQGFFSGFWLEVQRLTKTPEQTRADADFLTTVCELNSPQELLDVPCGEGRLSLEMARRGHNVTGLDITWPLLEDARHKGEAEGLAVDWQHGDMRELTQEEDFDAAFCFWGSIGYFTDEGNQQFFSGVNRALRPGGRFVIDNHVLESLLLSYEEKTWRQVGEILVLEERSYDVRQSRIESVWTFVRSGMTQTRRSSIRLYSYRELCGLLSSSGFSKFEGYGSLDGEPFRLGSPRLYLVATK